jgi:hypothetical protein
MCPKGWSLFFVTKALRRVSPEEAQAPEGTTPATGSAALLEGRNGCELDRGCLDQDTNSNEAIAVSRITQNDQIGLLEPRVGT